MSGPRGISLHIGVNFVDKSHYGGEWDGKLDWAEKDSDDILNIAGRQGFETRSLKSQEATRETVLSTIGDIAKGLKAGDFFLLSYSGHGGTIPDVDGDEDDLVDETWCLFNGQLLDDELSVLWSAFQPGVRILVLSDSCHSGTLLKSIDENSIQLQQVGKTVDPDEVFEHARAMPRDVAKSTARSTTPTWHASKTMTRTGTGSGGFVANSWKADKIWVSFINIYTNSGAAIVSHRPSSCHTTNSTRNLKPGLPYSQSL